MPKDAKPIDAKALNESVQRLIKDKKLRQEMQAKPKETLAAMGLQPEGQAADFLRLFSRNEFEDGKKTGPNDGFQLACDC